MTELVPDNKESADPFLANACEILAKADAELGEHKRFEPKLPERPFVTGVASFLLDPTTALNWQCGFILGFILAVPLIALTMTYHRLMGRLAWVIQTNSEKTADAGANKNRSE